MQPIERYGVVALLFLVATFTAVLVMGEGTAMGAEPGSPDGDSFAKRDLNQAQPGSKRMRMTAGIKAAPLERESFAQQRSLQEDQAAQEEQRLMHERALRLERDRELEEARQSQASLAAGGDATLRGGFALGGERPMGKVPGAAASSISTPEPVAQSPRSALREYTVKPGDTMGEIALAELGTSKVWKLISEVNGGLTPSKLIVNRKIFLPSTERVTAALAKRSKGAPAATKKSAPKSSASVATSGTVTYTVAEGESLWRIAQKQLGDGKHFSAIVALNPGINPNNLRVGQKLKLPKGVTLNTAKSARPSAAIAQKKTAKRTGRVR